MSNFIRQLEETVGDVAMAAVVNQSEAVHAPGAPDGSAGAVWVVEVV